jgi:hypothetical protein
MAWTMDVFEPIEEEIFIFVILLGNYLKNYLGQMELETE